jgi:hypothetical protein
MTKHILWISSYEVTEIFIRRLVWTEDSHRTSEVRGYIQKFPDWVDNEINNNKHSLRNNTKG